MRSVEMKINFTIRPNVWCVEHKTNGEEIEKITYLLLCEGRQTIAKIEMENSEMLEINM